MNEFFLEYQAFFSKQHAHFDAHFDTHSEREKVPFIKTHQKDVFLTFILGHLLFL